MFFNKYPYTDNHELNLDWIIAKVKELTKIMDEWTVLNRLTWRGEWDISKAYPQFSIVEDNHNGYVSIKPVPRNVEISNTEYWQLVADYSALYSAFSQRITTLENKTETLENKTETLENKTETLENKKTDKKREMILIGDSFTGVIDAQHLDGYGWLPYVKDNYSAYANFYNNQTPLGGVYGFASSRPFLDVLQDCEQYIDDFNKITDIIVLGGTNDYGISISTVENAISEFCSYCKNKFTNAKIHIGKLSTLIERLRSVPYESCIKYGAEYIDSTMNIMCNPDYISDGTHLTQEGYNFYNPYVAEAIIFGKTSYRFELDFPITIANSNIGGFRAIVEPNIVSTVPYGNGAYPFLTNLYINTEQANGQNDIGTFSKIPHVIPDNIPILEGVHVTQTTNIGYQDIGVCRAYISGNILKSYSNTYNIFGTPFTSTTVLPTRYTLPT